MSVKSSNWVFLACLRAHVDNKYCLVSYKLILSTENIRQGEIAKNKYVYLNGLKVVSGIYSKIHGWLQSG